MPNPFIHLNVHSEYALVDSIVRIPELIDHVKTNQMPAVALTDHCNLFATLKFYRAAIAAGIKPILGADLLITVPEHPQVFTITVLCQNIIGYQNLIQLISQAYTQNDQGQLLVEWSWLIKHTEGLLILLGDLASDVAHALLSNQASTAEKCLLRWLTHFGKQQQLYLALQRTGKPEEERYIQAILPLARQYQIPVVAHNSVRFLHESDFMAHEARLCIQQGEILNDAKRVSGYNQQQYFKNSQQMAELFHDIPSALTNTVHIAKRCTVELTLDQLFLPQFPVPDSISTENYLAKQVETALQHYLAQHITDKELITHYQERLAHELTVINRMGFAGYFLIVADFVNWAKKNDIPVGPGRGSGAGSLVAFMLGITELDPITYDLLFERFLNPERISMPDFDIDFCMDGRDRVIEYVGKRYGHQAVAQIITYGTMAAKAVVRDVGRVLAMPYGFVDKVAKLIPFELGITLNKALTQEPQLKTRYDNEPEVNQLINLAIKLEGIVRNAGKHAGGVVIAPTKLTDFVALYCEAGSTQTVTQFDKDDIEKIGLVKFDFLGLRTLTIIDWTVKSINKKNQQQSKSPLVIQQLPLDDKKAYDLLKTGHTTAVFQLESRGIQELITRLQPDNFDDVMALVALYRPGPLQSGMVDDFIDRKHGRATVSYIHPELEPILKNTYGVIVYQEQVLQIAQRLAGYTLGAADILRRAMGKKKPEEMAEQRQIFLTGAANHGLATDTAETIFDLMEHFAGYGFNKSHSAAYALLSYQTAWLKAHYPAEFMAAVLSSDMDNTDKVVHLISECHLLKLTLLSPDINHSDYPFTTTKTGEILYGLGAIKGVGEAVVHQLVKAREQHGKFVSLFDFCERLQASKLTRRTLEALIYAGAMDTWQIPREQLIASVNKALQAAQQKQQQADHGQQDLFTDVMADEPTIVNQLSYELAKPWSERERLRYEKASLGYYLSGHPAQAIRHELAKLIHQPIAKLQTDQNALVVGESAKIKRIITKKGKQMAVVQLTDETATIEVMIFSKLYETVRAKLASGEIYVIRGEVKPDSFTGGIRLVADTVLSLDELRMQLAKRLVITVKNESAFVTIKNELLQLLEKNSKGHCPIVVQYTDMQANQAELMLGETWHTKPSEQLLTDLRNLSPNDTKIFLEY